VRAACMVGCMLCGRCAAKCSAGAITWTAETIVVDHEKSMAYEPSCNEACVDMCPSVIIDRVGQASVPEETKPEAAWRRAAASNSTVTEVLAHRSMALV
jgi:Na+-translocating ferredoxin:NAD+ oxidoreductase subunit B